MKQADSHVCSLVREVAGIYCMPWSLRGAEGEPVHGGVCLYCKTDIAVPNSRRGWRAACVKCGLDRGDLPSSDPNVFGPDCIITMSPAGERKTVMLRIIQ